MAQDSTLYTFSKHFHILVPFHPVRQSPMLCLKPLVPQISKQLKVDLEPGILSPWFLVWYISYPVTEPCVDLISVAVLSNNDGLCGESKPMAGPQVTWNCPQVALINHRGFSTSRVKSGSPPPSPGQCQTPSRQPGKGSHPTDRTSCTLREDSSRGA